MREPVYEVFARKNREDPLRHVGYVNAGDDDLARVYAWQTYDEQNWFEMYVAPRAALLLVVPHPDLEMGPDGDPRTAATVPAASGRVAHTAAAASYGGDDVVTEEGG